MFQLLVNRLHCGVKSVHIQPRYFFEVRFRKSGSTPADTIPFKVNRTPSGNLPVYIQKNASGEHVTVIKVRGNLLFAQKELLTLCSGSPVRKGGESKLEVRGDHEKTIKSWLTALGF